MARPAQDFDIDPDDEEALAGLAADLEDDLRAWLTSPAGGGVPEELAVGIAEAVWWLVEFSYRYRGEPVNRWTVADLREFLVGWCPAKVPLTAPPEYARVPAAAEALVSFLDEAGRLDDERGAPAGALLDTLDASAAVFADAMADRRRWGPAKAMTLALEADGIDLGDEDAVQAWVEAFNDRPFDERAAVLPGPNGPGLDDDADFDLFDDDFDPFDDDGELFDDGAGLLSGFEEFPPVVAPTADAVAASAAAAPVLDRFARLVTGLGEGRGLTQKGNLKLADARRLVEQLETGDRVDPVHGDTVYRTRSAQDLRHLDRVVRWALESGVVARRGGRMVPTAFGRTLADDPVEAVARIGLAALEMGLVTMNHGPGQRWGLWDAWRLLDEVVTTVLAMGLALSGAPDPGLRRADVVGIMAEAMEDALVLGPSWTAERAREHADHSLGEALDGLVEAGMVALATADGEPAEPSGAEVIVLTPIGFDVALRFVRSQGIEVTLAGELADRPLLEVLEVLADADEYRFSAELTAWRAARTPEVAAAELTEALAAVDDIALASAVFELLAGLGDDRVAAHEDELLAGGASAGPTLAWAVDRGRRPAASVYDEPPERVVEWLGARIVAGASELLGPDLDDDGPPTPEALQASLAPLLESLAAAGDRAAQVALLERLWRVDRPTTAFVLTTIGSVHPEKQVAKAARKCAMKHRTHQANRRR